jgi:Flp pilus assembly protein TadB
MGKSIAFSDLWWVVFLVAVVLGVLAATTGSMVLKVVGVFAAAFAGALFMERFERRRRRHRVQ